MKRKQIVIKVRELFEWRGTDYGVVTDDKLDVFQRAVEAGIGKETAEKIAKWSEKAKDGESFRPRDAADRGGDPIKVMVECRSADGWKKNGRG